MKAKEGEKEKTLKSDSFLDAKKIPPSLLHLQSKKHAQQAARQHLRASARLLTLHTAACRWDAHPMVRETRAFAQWVGDGCSRAARDFLGMLRISEKMI